MRPAWAEVDLGAISANVQALRAMVAPAQFCAVVKADGYGHGAVEVARAAIAGGADVLAVALVAEGAELRKAGLTEPILMLSQSSPDEVHRLVANDLEATVYSDAGVAALADAARQAGRDLSRPLAVHLKVDTGMHRVGAQPEEVVELARHIERSAGLELASVFTHCAVADEPDNDFTAEQLRRYHAVLAELGGAGITVANRHMANTAAAIAHPETRFDLVRVGIGMYGLDASPAVSERVPLTPAMSLKARVSHVKRTSAGEGVSYGLRYRPERDTTIATVPLGYADGVPRRLAATAGVVLLGGKRRLIAGTITMDQFLVDCGDDPVAVGDEVVLLGSQGTETISADDWASRLDTINYEIVCGISSRVPRRYRPNKEITR